jgi:hypothetical protein
MGKRLPAKKAVKDKREERKLGEKIKRAIQPYKDKGKDGTKEPKK